MDAPGTAARGVLGSVLVNGAGAVTECSVWQLPQLPQREDDRLPLRRSTCCGAIHLPTHEMELPKDCALITDPPRLTAQPSQGSSSAT